MWITPDPVPAGFPAGTNPGDGLVWTGTQWNNVGGVRGPAGSDGADGADGAPGVDGLGFYYMGQYDPNVQYADRDVVTLDGQTYVVVDAQPNRRVVRTPDTFQLWAAKGADGAKGDAGADGAKGDPGADGDKGADGAKGDPGADGDKGADGAKGDAGDDGRSVAVTVAATQPATAAVGDFWIVPT
jgi:hypothetical protein